MTFLVEVNMQKAQANKNRKLGSLCWPERLDVFKSSSKEAQQQIDGSALEALLAEKP